VSAIYWLLNFVVFVVGDVTVAVVDFRVIEVDVGFYC